MQAVVIHRYGGPEVLAAAAVPLPEPAPGEVLVRLEAAGVNPIDTYVRSGGIERPEAFPHILGREGVGWVEQGAGPLQAGARVIVAGGGIGVNRPGTYAQYVAVPAEHVHPVPDWVPAGVAACLFVAAGAAYFGLRRSDAAARGTVAVLGASGAVGSAAVQMGKAMGLRVLAQVRDPAKVDLVAALGADRVIDTSREPLAAALLEATGGEGIPAAVDPLSGPFIAELVQAAAPGCRVATLGASAGGEVHYDARRFYHRGMTIEAVSMRRQPQAEIDAMFADMYRWLAAGQLQIPIEREFALTEAAAAHRYLFEGRKFGKAVLRL